MMTVAVVTYNQAGLLEKFLERFERRRMEKSHAISLLVLDDGSSDHTPEVLNTFSNRRKSWLLVYHSKHKGISAGRNTALSLCPTTWIAFTDTDCILDKTYFETLSRIPEKYADCIAVEGKVTGEQNNFPRFVHRMRNEKGKMYATANMIFHVQKTLAVGGFDERFKNYREDVDLGLRINKIIPIPFAEDLIVHHPNIPRNLWKELFTSMARAKNIIHSELLLFEKHPQDYQSVRAKKTGKETLTALWKKHAAIQTCEYFKEFNAEQHSLLKLFHPAFILTAIKIFIVSLWEQFSYFLHFLLRQKQNTPTNPLIGVRVN